MEREALKYGIEKEKLILLKPAEKYIVDTIPEGKAVNFDIAIVPIGGIFTMNAKQAPEFVNDMNPKILLM